jgi:fructosamine-3-kinase
MLRLPVAVQLVPGVHTAERHGGVLVVRRLASTENFDAGTYESDLADEPDDGCDPVFGTTPGHARSQASHTSTVVGMHTPTTMAARLGDVIGADIATVRRVAGGSICTSYRAELSDGRAVFVKTIERPPVAPFDGALFFPTEAFGLEWLDIAGGAPVPGVVAATEDLLVLDWVDEAPPTSAAAESLGRELAVTHRSGGELFGFECSGFLGPIPVSNERCWAWPEFFVSRRLEPLLRLAHDEGSLDRSGVAALRRVMARIYQLAGPPEPPQRLHGDLWSGNVVWCADGRCRLVDPSAYGGHRETDLAMLALFGAPHLDTIIASYDETYPLATGWRERVGLHQLVPLLVHAILFGGGYGSQLTATARSLL